MYERLIISDIREKNMVPIEFVIFLFIIRIYNSIPNSSSCGVSRMCDINVHLSSPKSTPRYIDLPIVNSMKK